MKGLVALSTALLVIACSPGTGTDAPAIVFSVPHDDPAFADATVAYAIDVVTGEVLSEILLSDGVAEIPVDPETDYVIALYSGSEGDVQSASTDKKPIKLIGSVKLSDGDIDAISLGSDALGRTDLGRLTKTGSTITAADRSLDEVALTLGRPASVLRDRGALDNITSVKANVDVDQNGIIDRDEGLEWVFTATFDYGSVSVANLETLSAFPEPRTFFSEVGTNGPLVSPTLAFIHGLNDPLDYEHVHLERTSVDGTVQFAGTQSHGDNFNLDHYQYYFEPLLTRDASNRDLNGDYVLTFDDGRLFRFDDMRFPELDAALDAPGRGALFPVVRLIDDGTNLTGVSWQWYVLRDGVVRIPDDETVRVYTDDLVFHFAVGSNTLMLYGQGDEPGTQSRGSWIQKYGPDIHSKPDVSFPGPMTHTSGTVNLEVGPVPIDEILQITVDYRDPALNAHIYRLNVGW